jgi:hypothetical protein
MRIAALLLCLPLAACQTSGDEPAPEAAIAPAAPAVASPPPVRSSGTGGPRGGATTAAARAEPVVAGPDALIQARANCWMMVEHQKEVRGIDQRITFVDKCVAGQMKGTPNP